MQETVFVYLHCALLKKQSKTNKKPNQNTTKTPATTIGWLFRNKMEVQTRATNIYHLIPDSVFSVLKFHDSW